MQLIIGGEKVGRVGSGIVILFVSMFATSAVASAAKPFSGNVCGAPNVSELSAVGIVTPCVKGKPKVDSGSELTSTIYSAQWGSVGAESDLPGVRPNLTIRVTKYVGSKAKLALIERYELRTITFKIGASNLNKVVNLDGARGGLHIKGPGTAELLIVADHLYGILIRLNEKEPFGSEAGLGTEIDSIGTSTVAAL